MHDEWHRKTLGTLIDLEYGSSLPASTRAGDGYPVFGSNGEVGKHSAGLVEGPGIVVGRKGTIGAVTWVGSDFWPIDTTYYVKSRGPRLRWLYWLLASLQLRRLDTSTGVPGLNREDVYRLELDVPSDAEQRSIAAILDTIDEAILDTEQLVAKLQQVNQGLLHDLLTLGIDENGEFRELEQSRSRFWGAPRSSVPNGWTVLPLSDACSLIRDGTHLPPSRVDDGPFLLSVRNMHNGELVVREDDTRVPWSFYRQMHTNWQIEQGDVLLAIVGATIGKYARVGDLPPFTLQRSVAVLRGSPHHLNNDFLSHVVQSAPFQNRLWQLANQTAQPGMYLEALGSISVPLPALEEQERIAQRLNSLRERIDGETALRDKFAGLKQGLMDDLLTGRVRVTPLLQRDSA
jgi:type I restriction enzyme, S subunit